MSLPPDLQFRTAVDADWPEIFAADNRAFGITAPVDDVQRASERARLAGDDTVIARDPALPGDPLVGTAAFYRLAMSVPGGRINFAGLTWVSVSPTHRRRGILRELITRLRSRWAAEGFPLAALWASEATIYERFGFGPAIFAEDVRITAPQTVRAPAPTRAQVRFVTADEFATLAPGMYARWADDHPGVLLRDAHWWAEALDDRPAARPFTTSERHHLVHADGYATYRLDSANMGPDELPVAQIEEVVAVTDEAHTELWRTLAALDLVAATTATLAVGDPLPLKIADLRGVKTTARYDTLWVAILDVPAALGARRYAGDLDTTLIVDDPIGQAGGSYRLRISGGVAEVTRGEGADGEIACGINVLGSLYFGGIDARDFAAAGRLQASSPELLGRFADIWRTDAHAATGTAF